MKTEKQMVDGWNSVHFRSGYSPNKEPTKRDETTYIFRANLGNSDDERAALAVIAEAMDFPSYFGGNWDAVDECLTDLDWVSAENYVLEVSGSEAFWVGNHRVAARLVSAWLCAAKVWARKGIKFDLVFLP